MSGPPANGKEFLATRPELDHPKEIQKFQGLADLAGRHEDIEIEERVFEVAWFAYEKHVDQVGEEQEPVHGVCGVERR